jgi:hypothetical protein
MYEKFFCGDEYFYADEPTTPAKKKQTSNMRSAAPEAALLNATGDGEHFFSGLPVDQSCRSIRTA